MIRVFKELIFSGIVLFASLVQGSEFIAHGHKFDFEIPKGWQRIAPNKNNFVIQGPANGGDSHPVLFISNTGLEGASFQSAPMQVTMDAYYEGRKKYIESKGGVLLRFEPYTISRSPASQEFHTVGVDYRLGTETYHEVSQYVSCGGSIFHIKTLDFAATGNSASAFSYSRGFKCAR